jgi:uncharacterized MAPEG superfamily protein
MPTSPAELSWLALTLALTLAFWLPYVLNRVVVRGLAGTFANPSSTDTPLAPWAQRARQAHANAVENLAVFAPAVLLVHAAGAANTWTAAACAVYFWARLTHYVVYTLGIPVLRTLAWTAGWAATVILIARLWRML